jgi:glutathione synthase/RimK-type ligase-like ATP-grasp enzyme
VIRSLLPAKLRSELGDLYRRWSIRRTIDPLPRDIIVPLDETPDVLLLCSELVPYFDTKIYLQELAFAHELETRKRSFAIADDPRILIDKSVVWFLPDRLISPQLWDYARQVFEFAAGLERQGNRLFCSSNETLYWENKAYMHRALAKVGAFTPRTVILTRSNWRSMTFDIEPALIKEEHSAGSYGVHYFSHATKAREFVQHYPFRPAESLLMQEVVPGATRDMRLTMVGDRMVRSATFWRIKTEEALSNPGWTTTATTYGSVVDHSNIPEWVVPIAGEYLRKLGIRTAGIDIMWADDDFSNHPLILELSPFYQPNPPKPLKYQHWSYKKYKRRPYVKDGYFSQQYLVFREIAGHILDQGLF